MATAPSFATTPNISVSTSSSAVTAIDGSGSLTNGITAGGSGTRVERIRVKCAATSAAANVNIFINNGSTSYLLTTISVTAVTSSNTQPTFESVQTLGLILPSGYSLKWATTIAQATNVTMEGYDV